MTEQELREQICQIGRLMRQYNYIDGGSGNITARLDSERILATPSGIAKACMTPDQLIILDMNGEKVGPSTPANEHLRPTSELLMHLECYRQRPDVNGVVHAHPPTAVALTLVGYDFERCIIPEVIVSLGMIASTPYSTPASTENRDAISAKVREHDAIMLAHHGSLTVAENVWKAYLRLETLERAAEMLYMAEQLGGAHTLPYAQVEKLLATRKRLGLMRPGDDERFRKASGAPSTQNK